MVKDRKQDEDWEDAIRTTRTRISQKPMKWALEEATGSAVVRNPGAEEVVESARAAEEAGDRDGDQEEDWAGAREGDRAGARDRNKHSTMNPAKEGK